MMPFELRDLTTLPEDLRKAYGPIIETCARTLKLGKPSGLDKPSDQLSERDERGAKEIAPKEIAYLTVHESVVPAGESQRRPGLHTEGFCRMPCEAGQIIRQPYWHYWGFGRVLRPGTFSGGIFMASSVSGSCHVYNALVPPELVGAGGDVEHLRDVLHKVLPNEPKPRERRRKEMCADQRSPGETRAIGPAHLTEERSPYRGPIALQANELFWMTDATPHASLPLREGTRRQYFRLVTGQVDAWFAAHSTKNPLGTQPAAKVVVHDKFSGRMPTRAPTLPSTPAAAEPAAANTHDAAAALGAMSIA